VGILSGQGNFLLRVGEDAEEKQQQCDTNADQQEQ
jgi:hypothetical protein